MGGRLNIWDFDNTLAWSERVADAYSLEHPNVEGWRLWHDPDLSSELVLEAMPVLDMWQRVASTPGTHWVLSGRTLDALELWMTLWQGHPQLGPLVDSIVRVASTSLNAPTPDTHLRKVQWISQEAVGFDEVHFYDDTYRNIQAVEDALPWVNTHWVRNGRVVSASAQSVEQGLNQIMQSMKALQDLEGLSTSESYKTLFRDTVNTLRGAQRDLLMKQPTSELLHLISMQLDRNGMQMVGDLHKAAAKVDGGGEAYIDVRIDDKLEDVKRSPAIKATRLLHSLKVQIAATFDRLSVPMVGVVDEPIREDGLLVGYVVKIWKIGDTDE